jgi:hypothetical protein
MEYLADTTIRPPYDDNEYQIQIVDYGQGIKHLSVHNISDENSYKFHVTNIDRKECQWRNKDAKIPNDIHKAIEYYGYHITDEQNLPQHGLYQNVKYISDVVDEIDSELIESDYIAKAGIDWVKESLDLLQKLEILRARLTDVEFEVVCCKAYESSKKGSDGLINFHTLKGKKVSTTLNLLVLRIIAYAQKDGYIDIEIIPPSFVDRLTMEVPK